MVGVGGEVWVGESCLEEAEDGVTEEGFRTWALVLGSEHETEEMTNCFWLR